MIINSDCREGMSWFEPDSIDAIVTDPPYELGVMGRAWDASGIAYDPEVWRQALRVLKPGGHLLAFGGTRTYHRMTCAIEDAGFEIRDSLMWIYSSGFPKSHNLAPAIDKMMGAMGHRGTGFNTAGLEAGFTRPGGNMEAHTAITPEAQQWQGWGTALKPAFEPIVLARKPLRGTVAANVLAHGTGALNIDGCRVETKDDLNGGCYSGGIPKTMFSGLGRLEPDQFVRPQGRWPANVIHDGSDEVVAGFPFDTSRFFYGSKASRRDRDEGLEDFPVKRAGGMAATEDGSMLTGAGPTRTPR